MMRQRFDITATAWIPNDAKVNPRLKVALIGDEMVRGLLLQGDVLSQVELYFTGSDAGQVELLDRIIEGLLAVRGAALKRAAEQPAEAATS